MKKVRFLMLASVLVLCTSACGKESTTSEGDKLIEVGYESSETNSETSENTEGSKPTDENINIPNVDETPLVEEEAEGDLRVDHGIAMLDKYKVTIDRYIELDIMATDDFGAEFEGELPSSKISEQSKVVAIIDENKGISYVVEDKVTNVLDSETTSNVVTWVSKTNTDDYKMYQQDTDGQWLVTESYTNKFSATSYYNEINKTEFYKVENGTEIYNGTIAFFSIAQNVYDAVGYVELDETTLLPITYCFFEGTDMLKNIKLDYKNEDLGLIIKIDMEFSKDDIPDIDLPKEITE